MLPNYQVRIPMKQMKKCLVFLIPVLIFSLQGCSTPEEQRAYQQQAEYARMQAAAQQRQSLENQCTGFGFRKGTDSFAQCVQQQQERERASLKKEQCEAKAYDRNCAWGCADPHGQYFRLLPECMESCKAGQRASAAACHGIFIPPAQQQIIIQQGGGNQNPFPNMNKCIQDGGSIMCLR